MRISEKCQNALLVTVQSSGDLETDSSLFAATVKEVEKGFIEGPGQREFASRVDLDKAFASEAEEQGQTHR